MYRITHIGTALLVIMATLAPASLTRASDPVLNIGHRGASGYAPEHTFASYDLARSLGADYLEQDLQLTSDGVLVVLHDTTLDRTARGLAANCTGLVSDKTLAQIKTCDVGTWFNEANPTLARPEYVGLKIPTSKKCSNATGGASTTTSRRKPRTPPTTWKSGCWRSSTNIDCCGPRPDGGKC